MRIANNIPALNTALTLKSTDRLVVDAMQKISTGSKINSAKNDPAGLAIANKLGVQVTGLNRASQNSMDGISLIQTTDGSLNEVSNMIQRMRELAVQAASDVLDPSDKNKVQMEVNQLIEEINANSFRTEFNRIKVLSGEASFIVPMIAAESNQEIGPMYLQIGPNYNQHIPVNIPRLDSETLGLVEYSGDLMKIIPDLGSQTGASNAITIFDNALYEVSHVRSILGAYQNRLEHTVMNLDSASVNTEIARSRIQDTDMAASMTEYAQNNVRYQAGIAILSQANLRPQQILSLLQ